MLKTTLIAAAAAGLATSATLVYVGTTTYSTAFQADAPFNGAIKVTPDPGNVWSWHHEVVHPGGTVPATVADVLVDIDGDQVMDTVHPEVRVMITDLQLVAPWVGPIGFARIVDASGRRLTVGVGGFQSAGAVQHVSLTTPIVLPVGSFLHVEVYGDNSTYEVNLIGRIVNP